MVAPRFFYGLQFKLILAFSLIVIVALVLAGGVFVAVQRGEAKDRALDHVVAASPPIYTDFTVLQRRDEPPETIAEYVDAAASQLDLRILVVSRTDGTIMHDTDDDLTGEEITVPRGVELERASKVQPYVSWNPPDGTPGDRLVFVTALRTNGHRGGLVPSTADEPYWMLLAIQEDTVATAWRAVLPQLGLAAAIALPIAVVLAMLLANYISRPLQQLTTASQRVAEGNYDVHVAINRRDEVGRLAKSFSTMAQRVGETHSQMRALIANVSHDLKTPLTSILGFSQALRDSRSESDDARHMGDVIHNEANRLNARLNDLLYLAELESGQTVVQHDEIDMRRLVETSVERIEDDVRQRGVDLNVELTEATVSGDGPKLERAVENLLDNARKYTPGGGEIDVRLSPNGQGVKVEIANTAGDVSEDELPRLFERFYRRERARTGTSARGGSGLGLAIARDLVEMHGGALDAGLHDGQLAFTMTLPAAPQNGTAPAGAQPTRTS
jgi:signal transduction histidine kinase